VPEASPEAKRLVAIGTAMCRKIGIDMKVISFRTGPEHTEAMHDILDAVKGNPIAESFLDWLLELAAADFDKAAEDILTSRSRDSLRKIE